MHDAELLDELDENGLQTGRQLSRDLVHSSGAWHKTVHIWVLNPNQELLLQQRSFTKESHPGYWDISAAGHCSSGDSSLEAARRELREELGIEVRQQELSYLFSVVQRFILNKGRFVDNEFCDVYLYRTRISGEKIAIDPAEVRQVRFVNWMVLQKEYRGPDFVRHDEEYERLFRILGEEFHR